MKPADQRRAILAPTAAAQCAAFLGKQGTSGGAAATPPATQRGPTRMVSPARRKPQAIPAIRARCAPNHLFAAPKEAKTATTFGVARASRTAVAPISPTSATSQISTATREAAARSKHEPTTSTRTAERRIVALPNKQPGGDIANKGERQIQVRITRHPQMEIRCFSSNHDARQNKRVVKPRPNG